MTEPLPADKSVELLRRGLISWRPESLLAVAVVIACLAGLVLSTSTDQDLWGHLAFGRDIVQHRAIARVDPYSFTSDRPWVNHEWLAEVLMYAAYASLGPAGLVALKVLVGAAALWLILRELIPRRLTLELFALLFLIAIVGTKAQTGQLRPQLFSLALFTALLTILTGVETSDSRWLLALPAIFLAWANLHGGWIVGAGVLALWTLFQLLDSTRPTGYRKRCLLAAAGAAAATLVNPFGVGLWAFLLQTVRTNRADITDWQPITYSVDLLIVWLAIAVTTVLLLRRARVKPSPFTIAALVLLAAGSFRVLRLEAFFALASVLLLPRWLTMAPVAAGGRVQAASAPVSHGAEAVVVLGALMVIATSGVVVARNASCVPLDPAGSPEPEAAAFFRMNHLEGRTITWFDWGEYAIWHLAPAIKVSIDGRRETTYSADIVASHLAFYRDEQPAGATIAERWNADYIWLPRDVPVVATLKATGWTPIFDGPVSIVLSRSPSTAMLRPFPSPASRRCFPGP